MENADKVKGHQAAPSASVPPWCAHAFGRREVQSVQTVERRAGHGAAVILKPSVCFSWFIRCADMVAGVPVHSSRLSSGCGRLRHGRQGRGRGTQAAAWAGCRPEAVGTEASHQGRDAKKKKPLPLPLPLPVEAVPIRQPLHLMEEGDAKKKKHPCPLFEDRSAYLRQKVSSNKVDVSL